MRDKLDFIVTQFNEGSSGTVGESRNVDTHVLVLEVHKSANPDLKFILRYDLTIFDSQNPDPEASSGSEILQFLTHRWWCH